MEEADVKSMNEFERQVFAAVVADTIGKFPGASSKVTPAKVAVRDATAAVLALRTLGDLVDAGEDPPLGIGPRSLDETERQFLMEYLGRVEQKIYMQDC
jgi:hypothetical protein